MTYHIINPPDSIPSVYKQYITKAPNKIYTKGEGFNNYVMSAPLYSPAVTELVEILIKTVFEKEKTFRDLFYKYCDFIQLTSMDRPYGKKESSHYIAGQAVDLILYPYYLNPLFHSVLMKYSKEKKFTTFISLINHHIHFNISKTPNTGFEMAYINDKPLIPSRVRDNFNKLIDSNKARFVISHNFPVFASAVMNYYNMGVCASSILGGIFSDANAPVEGETILKLTADNYGIPVQGFYNYLKSLGKYVDMYDYLKSISPSEFGKAVNEFFDEKKK